MHVGGAATARRLAMAEAMREESLQYRKLSETDSGEAVRRAGGHGPQQPGRRFSCRDRNSMRASIRLLRLACRLNKEAEKKRSGCAAWA